MVDIKKLATSKKSGYRFKEVLIPEWDNVSIIIREPGVNTWRLWQEKHNEANLLDDDEKSQKQQEADAVLFAGVVLNSDHEFVFSSDDLSPLAAAYGPVHIRLVNQAIQLGGLNNASEQAEKK